jgi:hypothetical protein
MNRRLFGVGMDPDVYSLCEAVADITDMWSNPRSAPLVSCDSRETVSLSIEWAEEFESENKGVEWGVDGREYMDEIGFFFRKKYDAWKGGPAGRRPHHRRG